MVCFTSISVLPRSWLMVYFIMWIPRSLTAAKIAVMASPGINNRNMMNIASQLLVLNHHVTLIVPDYVGNLSGKSVPGLDIIFYITSKELNKMEKVVTSSYSTERQLVIVMTLFRKAIERILRDDGLYEYLQIQNFDLFIGDFHFEMRPLSILPYRLGVPYVLVGPEWNMWTPSIPILPSFVPHFLLYFTDKMTLFERMWNLLICVTDMTLKPLNEWNDIDVAVFAPEMPFMSVDRLVGYAQLWIVDSHVLMGYAQPTMPKVKFIGGLELSPTQPLDGPLKHFMANAGEGVVLVSFSSLLPVNQQHVEKFLEAFKSLPYKIVWRINDVQNSYDSIYTNKWIPQNDLLAHNNTKVFVTHCGDADQFEALYHGVPMLGIPASVGEHNNAIRMISKGYGLALNFATVTSDQLVTAITEIITKSIYQENIKRASAAYRSELRGELPSAKAAFWVDHVIKHGGTYMRSTGEDMTWYEYFLLDVVGIFLVCLIVVVFYFIGVIKTMCC